MIRPLFWQIPGFLSSYTQIRDTNPTSVWLCLPITSAPKRQSFLIIPEVFPPDPDPTPKPLSQEISIVCFSCIRAWHHLFQAPWRNHHRASLSCNTTGSSISQPEEMDSQRLKFLALSREQISFWICQKWQGCPWQHL